MRVAEIDTVGIGDVGSGLCGISGKKGQVAGLGVGFIVAGIEIEGMDSVKVSIERIAHICSIEGRGKIVAHSQTMHMLSHAVKIVVLRQSANEFEELVFID